MEQRLLLIAMLIASVASIALLPSDECDELEIGGDLESTYCIVERLCANHSDPVAESFFGCYESVGIGRDQFLGCQHECLGEYLDTPQHIDQLCANLPPFIECYPPCLYVSFAEAGLNLTVAAIGINQCQGKVLGLNVPEEEW